MSRQRLLDLALGLAVAALFFGYAIYLAIEITKNGGVW